VHSIDVIPMYLEVVLVFLVGVDPGGTTGVAWRDRSGRVVSVDVEVGLDWSRVADVVATVRRVVEESGAGGWSGARLYVEDFVLVPRSVLSRDGSTPLVVIGALYGAFGRLVSLGQNAALAKSTFTDKRLRALGLWDKRSAHQRDAIRHLLLAERREKGRKG